MTTLGVLGRGGATPPEVIDAGLLDSVDAIKDKIHLPWYGKPIPSDLETVYDWVMDNEVSFVIHAEDINSVPKAFRACLFGEVVEGDPIVGVASACSTLLYLWDDNSATLESVNDLSKAPSLILDLTSGLIPIEFESEEEAISSPPSSKYDDDDDDEEEPPLAMTREELEIMPALSVKRYASAKLGTVFASKSAAIEALFPTADVEVEEDPTDDDAPAPKAQVGKTSSLNEALNVFSKLLDMIEDFPESASRDQSLARLRESQMWCSLSFSKEA
jgi:hypothetical protein